MTGARSGCIPRICLSSDDGKRREPVDLGVDPGRGEAVAVDERRVLFVESKERTASVVTVPATPTACVGRGSSGSTARTCSRHGELGRVGVVRAKEALGQANAAEVEAPVPVAEDELGRAAADVDDQRSRRKRAPGGDPGVGESRLLISGRRRVSKP